VSPSCPSQPAGNANEQKPPIWAMRASACGLLPFAFAGPGGEK
jgi:hypothetical protein